MAKDNANLHQDKRAKNDEFFTRLFQACDIPRFDEVKRIQYEKDMFDEMLEALSVINQSI